MKNIQEIFNRIQGKKKEMKEIRAAYKDTLEHTDGYKDVLEEIKTLRAQKKQMEDGAKAEMGKDFVRLEDLKIDIAEDQDMINDIALNQIMKGESVRIVDGDNNAYEPIFSVKFKKTYDEPNNQGTKI